MNKHNVSRLIQQRVHWLMLCLLLVGCAAPSIQPVQPEAGERGQTSTSTLPSAQIPPLPISVAEEENRNDDEAPENGFCALSVDGTNYSSRGGTFSASSGPGSPPLHGPLVFSTVTAMIEALGGTPLDPSELGSNEQPPAVILVLDEFSRPISRTVEGQPVEEIDASRVISYEVWEVPITRDPNTEVISTTGPVIVAQVDIQDFKLGRVADALVSAIATFRQETGAEDFVINMSWVVVPCGEIPTDVVDYMEKLCDAFSANELMTFATIQALVTWLAANSPSVTICDGTMSTITATVPSTITASIFNTHDFARLWLTVDESSDARATETIMYLVTQCLGSPNVENPACVQLGLFELLGLTSPNNGQAEQQFIAVAASGNSTFTLAIDYPFEPALWPSVLSVSANDAVEYHAHPGEVAFKGTHPFAVDHLGKAMVGTSFAAPRMSLWAAIYLLNGGSSPCPTVPSFVPALGYKGEPDLIYNNLPVLAAASNYCEPFENLLTGWTDIIHPAVEP